jgi:hypothetical protein
MPVSGAVAVGLLTAAELDRVGVRVAEEHGHLASLAGLMRKQAVEVRQQLVKEHSGIDQDAYPVFSRGST